MGYEDNEKNREKIKNLSIREWKKLPLSAKYRRVVIHEKHLNENLLNHLIIRGVNVINIRKRYNKMVKKKKYACDVKKSDSDSELSDDSDSDSDSDDSEDSKEEIHDLKRENEKLSKRNTMLQEELYETKERLNNSISLMKDRLSYLEEENNEQLSFIKNIVKILNKDDNNCQLSPTIKSFDKFEDSFVEYLEKALNDKNVFKKKSDQYRKQVIYLKNETEQQEKEILSLREQLNQSKPDDKEIERQNKLFESFRIFLDHNGLCLTDINVPLSAYENKISKLEAENKFMRDEFGKLCEKFARNVDSIKEDLENELKSIFEKINK